MKTKIITRIIIILCILIVNVGCDRVSKVLVRQTIDYNETIGYFNNHVTLTRMENTGAFLSVGNDLPEFVRILFLIVFPLLALMLTTYFLFTKKGLSWWTIAGIACIIAGGMGNLYDRMLFGSVTDFMHINFLIFQTGIFNMADVSIMAGTAIVVLQMFRRKQISSGLQ